MCSFRFLQTVVTGAVCLAMVYGAEAASMPSFTYDTQTGILRVDAELDPGTTLVSWIVQGPQAQNILAFQDGTFSEGSDWVQGYFEGKEQWIALTGSGVNGAWDLALYPTSLVLSAFGQVEYGLRLPGGAGQTGFTTVTAPPMLEGDLNGDGFVGILDLNMVLGVWNQTVPPADPAADPSGDNFIGIQDLNTVLGNWNNGTPPMTGTVVPEPAWALFVLTPTLLRRRVVCVDL